MQQSNFRQICNNTIDQFVALRHTKEEYRVFHTFIVECVVNGELTEPNKEETDYFCNIILPKVVNCILDLNCSGYSRINDLINILSRTADLYAKVICKEKYFEFLIGASSLFSNQDSMFYKSSGSEFISDVSSALKSVINSVGIDALERDVRNYFSKTNIKDFKHTNIILSAIYHINRTNLTSINVKKLAEFFVPSICSAIRFQKKINHRDVDEKTIEKTFDLLYKLSSGSEFSSTVVENHVSFEVHLIKSDLLKQKLSALESICKMFGSTSSQLVCDILLKNDFVELTFAGMHHSLLQYFSTIVVQMNKLHLVDQKFFKKFWQFTLQQRSSSSEQYFEFWKDIIKNNRSDLNDSLFDTFAETTDLYQGVLCFLKEVSSSCGVNQKKKIFNLLNDYCNQNPSEYNAEVLICYMPNDQHFLNETNNTYLNMMVKDENKYYATTLIRRSCSFLSRENSMVFFNQTIKLISENPGSIASLMVALQSVMPNILNCLSDDDYNRLFNILEPLSKSNIQLLSDFVSKLYSSFVKPPFIHSAKLKLFEIITSSDTLTDDLSTAVFKLYEDINEDKNDDDNSKCIGQLWQLLFRTGNKVISNLLVNIYSRNDNSESLKFCILNCIQNIRTIGAKVFLSSIINYVEGGYYRPTLSLEPVNKFIPKSKYITIKLTGRISQDIKVEKDVTFANLRSMIGGILGLDQNSILLKTCYDEYITSSNFMLKHEMTINVSLSYTTKHIDIPKFLPSTFLLEHDNAKVLLELLKEDESQASQAFDLLCILPTIKTEIELLLSENPCWKSFFDCTCKYLLLYRFNAFATAIQNNDDLTKKCIRLNCIAPIINMLVNVSQDCDIMRILFYVQTMLFQNPEWKECSETIVNDVDADIVFHLLIPLFTSFHFAPLLTIIYNFYQYSPKKLIEHKDFPLLVKNAIFHSNEDVKKICMRLVKQLSLEDQSKILLPLLEGANNKEYFELLYDTVEIQDPVPFWNHLYEDFMSKMKLPDDPIECLNASVPSQHYINGVCDIFVKVIPKLPNDISLDFFLDFIFDNVIFNKYKYFNLSAGLLGTVKCIMEKSEDLINKVFDTISHVRKAIESRTVPRCPPDNVKYKGLRNLTSTCYLNSSIQQLYNIKSFRSLVFNIDCPSDWFIEFQNLFFSLRSFPSSYIDTQPFISKLKINGNRSIDVTEQFDAIEFFEMFMSKLEEITPELTEFTLGKMKNTIVGVSNDLLSECYENFQALRLDVKNHKDIHESIKSFMRPDILNDRNKYRVSDGFFIDAKRYHCIVEAPKILVVALNRFMYNLNLGTREKINDKFEITEELDISELTQGQTQKYKLIGVIMHHGTPNSGHYYSHVLINDEWFTFNDTKVTKVKLQDVLAEATGGDFLTPNTYYTYNSFEKQRMTSAYLLFYKSVDFIDEETPISKEIIERNLENIKIFLYSHAMSSPDFMELFLSFNNFDASGRFAFDQFASLIRTNNNSKDIKTILSKLVEIARASENFSGHILSRIDLFVEFGILHSMKHIREIYSELIESMMDHIDPKIITEFLDNVLLQMPWTKLRYDCFDEFVTPYIKCVRLYPDLTLHWGFHFRDILRFLEKSHGSEDFSANCSASRLFYILTILPPNSEDGAFILDRILLWSGNYRSVYSFCKYAGGVIDKNSLQNMINNINNVGELSSKILSCLFITSFFAPTTDLANHLFLISKRLNSKSCVSSLCDINETLRSNSPDPLLQKGFLKVLDQFLTIFFITIRKESFKYSYETVHIIYPFLKDSELDSEQKIVAQMIFNVIAELSSQLSSQYTKFVGKIEAFHQISVFNDINPTIQYFNWLSNLAKIGISSKYVYSTCSKICEVFSDSFRNSPNNLSLIALFDFINTTVGKENSSEYFKIINQKIFYQILDCTNFQYHIRDDTFSDFVVRVYDFIPMNGFKLFVKSTFFDNSIKNGFCLISGVRLVRNITEKLADDTSHLVAPKLFSMKLFDLMLKKSCYNYFKLVYKILINYPNTSSQFHKDIHWQSVFVEALTTNDELLQYKLLKMLYAFNVSYVKTNKGVRRIALFHPLKAFSKQWEVYIGQINEMTKFVHRYVFRFPGYLYLLTSLASLLSNVVVNNIVYINEINPDFIFKYDERYQEVAALYIKTYLIEGFSYIKEARSLEYILTVLLNPKTSVLATIRLIECVLYINTKKTISWNSNLINAISLCFSYNNSLDLYKQVVLKVEPICMLLPVSDFDSIVKRCFMLLSNVSRPFCSDLIIRIGFAFRFIYIMAKHHNKSIKDIIIVPEDFKNIRSEVEKLGHEFSSAFSFVTQFVSK